MDEIVYENHPFKAEIYATGDSEYYMIKGLVHKKYKILEEYCKTVAIVREEKKIIVKDGIKVEKYICDLRGILKPDNNNIYDFLKLKELMEEHYPECYKKINEIESLNRTSKHTHGHSIFLKPSALNKRKETILKSNGIS
ncbi:hypothetical protein GQ472_06020 [archaeon]|nr:hypothetical protein [archaeon]